MAVDKKFINVLLLGLGFMFVFTAFQTMGNIVKTILDSIHNDDPNFNGDGYVCMAIIYAVFSFANWLAPSYISATGPRVAIFTGAVLYLVYIASFLFPHTWLLYTTSALVGLGAAVIWTGQGNYLTLNSTKETISRNSGIFWALLQCSMFFGNIFVFFEFQNKKTIDKGTRTVVFWSLSGVSIVGIIIILLLRKAERSEDHELSEDKSPVTALKDAGKLFTTKEMLLLSIAFVYTGLALSFYSGVYSPSIGFTTQMGSDAKQLVGLSGILIGVGEVLGGCLFGLLGSKTNKWGRDPIVIGGYLIQVLAYFIIFLNLPNQSPFGNTNDTGFINPSPALAIFCSFLLGFGDACYNTQIYGLLGSVYSDVSAEAFAIFKFSQSIAAAASFFYSSHLALYYQLLILIIFGTIGTITYVQVEVINRRKIISPDHTRINVDESP